MAKEIKEIKEGSPFIKTIKDKAIAGAVWFMLSTGALFLFNRGLTIWNMPDTVKHLEALHITDSTEHRKDEFEKRRYRHKQDSINEEHWFWMGIIYNRVDSLKNVIKNMKHK